MKPRLPIITPDARTVLPGRAVTYHATAPVRAPVPVLASTRSNKRPFHDMRRLVLDVLVGARERWEKLSIAEKQKIVVQLRAIADTIETSIGGKSP